MWLKGGLFTWPNQDDQIYFGHIHPLMFACQLICNLWQPSFHYTLLEFFFAKSCWLSQKLYLSFDDFVDAGMMPIAPGPQNCIQIQNRLSGSGIINCLNFLQNFVPFRFVVFFLIIAKGLLKLWTLILRDGFNKDEYWIVSWW